MTRLRPIIDKKIFLRRRTEHGCRRICGKMPWTAQSVETNCRNAQQQTNIHFHDNSVKLHSVI